MNSSPWVTGSIGIPALRVVVAARDRERPEVRRRPGEDDQEQQQRVRIDGPVTAVQPSTGGAAPAAPPITMFCGVACFSQTV